MSSGEFLEKGDHAKLQDADSSHSSMVEKEEEVGAFGGAQQDVKNLKVKLMIALQKPFSFLLLP